MGGLWRIPNFLRGFSVTRYTLMELLYHVIALQFWNISAPNLYFLAPWILIHSYWAYLGIPYVFQQPLEIRSLCCWREWLGFFRNFVMCVLEANSTYLTFMFGSVVPGNIHFIDELHGKIALPNAAYILSSTV